MSSIEALREELEALGEILRPLVESPAEPWTAAWVNMQTLMSRQADLLHWLEIEEGEFELEFRLIGSEIQNSSIGTAFFGSLLSTLQASLYAIGDSLMTRRPRVHGRYPKDVLDEATLRLKATRPGSFIIGMEGPLDRGVQLTVAEEMELEENLELPVFDDAVKRVLDVFDAAENEVDGEWLTNSIGELGSNRALSKMIDLAKVLSSTRVESVAVNRSRFLGHPRECRLSAPGAARLRGVLLRTQMDTRIVEMHGLLSGIRWKSGLFDLDTDEFGTITGRIPVELREDVRDLFDSFVHVNVEMTSTTTPVEGEPKMTYRLVELL